MIWNKLKKELDGVKPEDAAVYMTAERMKSATAENETHRGNSLVWKTAVSFAMVAVIVCVGVFGMNPFKKTAQVDSPFTLVAYAAEDNVISENGQFNNSSKKMPLEHDMEVVFPKDINILDTLRKHISRETDDLLGEKRESGASELEIEYKREVFGQYALKCEGVNLKTVTFESEDTVLTYFDNEYFEQLKEQGLFAKNDEIHVGELTVLLKKDETPVSQEIVNKLFKIDNKVTGNPGAFFSWTWNFPEDYYANAEKSGNYEYDNISILVTAETNDGTIAKQRLKISIDKDGAIKAKTEAVK